MSTACFLEQGIYNGPFHLTRSRVRYELAQVIDTRYQYNTRNRYVVHRDQAGNQCAAADPHDDEFVSGHEDQPGYRHIKQLCGCCRSARLVRDHLRELFRGHGSDPLRSESTFRDTRRTLAALRPACHPAPLRLHRHKPLGRLKACDFHNRTASCQSAGVPSVSQDSQQRHLLA